MKITDESTVVMNTAKQSARSNKRRFWQETVIAGVPAILFGSLGTIYASNGGSEGVEGLAEDLNETEIAVEETADVADAPLAVSQIDVEMAGSVNDCMSFSEAFEAARAEVGPGGVFSWNGNLYSTYYTEEWSSMTDEQKEEFVDAVDEFVDTVNVDDSQSGAEGDVVPVSEVEYHETSGGESEIVVLGQETVEADNGQLVTVTMVEENGHYGEYYDFNNDGQQDAALFDTNDDGRPDLQIIDENGDGYIDDNEVYMLNESDMVAEACYAPEDALYDGMPDYTNDADTSSFA